VRSGDRRCSEWASPTLRRSSSCSPGSPPPGPRGSFATASWLAGALRAAGRCGRIYVAHLTTLLAVAALAILMLQQLGRAEVPAAVEVTVDDEGRGIPADQMGQVFMPFQRGDPSRSRGHGGNRPRPQHRADHRPWPWRHDRARQRGRRGLARPRPAAALERHREPVRAGPDPAIRPRAMQAQGSGSIVNVSSTYGHEGARRQDR
jgi:hypothetical protein